MAILVTVTGVVQGVGFRPHVYRRAVSAGYSGWVANFPSGVLIYLQVDITEADQAVTELLADLPPVARVDGYSVKEVPSKNVEGFTIAESSSSGRMAVEIPHDLAACDNCIAEMRDRENRRYRYPYITCTNCGPRYSVITALPYDRSNTSMAPWAMCRACAEEYHNPADRRFHAESTACWDCGPSYVLYRNDGNGGVFERTDLVGVAAVTEVAGLLGSGEIIAIKGIGGYHLACDAEDATAVAKLRKAKFRKEKPFALMARDIDTILEVCSVSEDAEVVLTSPGAPIVLLPRSASLEGVAPDSDVFGVMLPYTPVHRLLFDLGSPPLLVMTSGNRASEPILYLDGDALNGFSGIARAVLVGERPIVRRLDDSIVFPLGAAPVLRRSRGMAPTSVADLDHQGPIIGFGADLKSTIAIAVEGKVFVSQYLGDLAYHEVQLSHRRTVLDLADMYGTDVHSALICSDLHPQYFSSSLAASFAVEMGTGEVLRVQHHRAHIASVLAESGDWDENVVGVAMDGTGYGDDGTIWGGEFFCGSLRSGLNRVASIDGDAHLFGGDAAAKYPLQALAGYLHNEGSWRLLADNVFGFDPSDLRALSSIRASGNDFLRTTSAGRLFDAMAAICGFVGRMTYEGQAAMWLESLAQRQIGNAAGSSTKYPQCYRFDLDGGGIGYEDVLNEAVLDRSNGVDPGRIALGFHLGFARAVALTATRIANETGSHTVALSGGVFQNRIFTSGVLDLLSRASLGVRMNRVLSCNDENISLGQVAIGAVSLSSSANLGRRAQ